MTTEEFSAYTQAHWDAWRESTRDLLGADALSPDPGRQRYRTDAAEPLLIGSREEYGLMRLGGHTVKYHLWCELLSVEPDPRLLFQVWRDETWKGVFLLSNPTGALGRFQWIDEQALSFED